jgi:hypothetical protein
MIMQGSKEYSYHFFPSIKSDLILHYILNDQSTKIENYTTQYTPLTIDANPDEKGAQLSQNS